MSEENVQAAPTEVSAPSDEVTQNVTETTVETTNEAPEQKVAETTEDNYDWVPKKYMRDGKPDFQAMEKARANLEKKLSQKGVSLAPESPAEYEYEFNIPGVQAESTEAFKEEALQMGLSVDQYKFLMGKYEAEISQYVPTAEKAEATLKADWGPDYQANLKNAYRAFEEYVPSDVSIEDIGNNPAVIKILAAIGAELGEESAPARSNRGTSSLTQADVEAMMLQPDYYDSNSDVRRQVQEWFRKNG